MLPGETIGSGAPDICPDCKMRLILKVLRSAAGYYLGTQCNCGPYSRESGYYPNKEEAEAALRRTQGLKLHADDSRTSRYVEEDKINNIARLITEDPDILPEEYCQACGGWDKKQGGIGHKYGCPKGKDGTPIAAQAADLRGISVVIDLIDSETCSLYNAIKNIGAIVAFNRNSVSDMVVKIGFRISDADSILDAIGRAIPRLAGGYELLFLSNDEIKNYESKEVDSKFMSRYVVW